MVHLVRRATRGSNEQLKTADAHKDENENPEYDMASQWQLEGT